VALVTPSRATKAVIILHIGGEPGCVQLQSEIAVRCGGAADRADDFVKARVRRDLRGQVRRAAAVFRAGPKDRVGRGDIAGGDAIRRHFGAESRGERHQNGDGEERAAERV